LRIKLSAGDGSWSGVSKRREVPRDYAWTKRKRPGIFVRILRKSICTESGLNFKKFTKGLRTLVVYP